MTFDEVSKLLSEWVNAQAESRLKRWENRKRAILSQYNKDVIAAKEDADKLARSLGVDTADHEKMGTLLMMAAGQRGIVLPTPAALFTANEGDNATGRLAQGSAGAAQADAGAGDGSREQLGEAAGSVAGQPGGNGASAQSRGKRSRHSA